MHINLFKHIGAAVKPQHAFYQRAQQPTSPPPGEVSSGPQDVVTLSPKAMKAIRVDHKSHHQAGHARAHENKINSLEKWVDKAASKTEANDGKIPFGMEWKLEYISTRIDKALTSNIDDEGNIINLTGAQQEKLIQINDKINSLLTPVSTDGVSTDENAAVVEPPVGDSSALVAPAEEDETPTVATTPVEENVPTDPPETTVALAEPETILDLLEEGLEEVTEEIA